MKLAIFSKLLYELFRLFFKILTLEHAAVFLLLSSKVVSGETLFSEVAERIQDRANEKKFVQKLSV